ncbi:MAG: hypothetical protein KGO94_05085 [Alphaproteobacteria bacterium]|nr:hypothetical protein [Alphaproteobacteria bacterium]
MSFLRTVALMVTGYVLMKTAKRMMQNIEAQQVKVKAKEPSMKDMPRLKLDPITGVYVPEA